MNGASTEFNLPALIQDQSGASRKTAHAKTLRDPAFEAQVMGQSGQRRGLKGGQPVLDAARAAYLDAEWRGPGDRRLPAGALRAVKL